MRPEQFDIEELIDAVNGTCTDLESHMPEGMEWKDLIKEDHNAIDNRIFYCEECGWWCEIGEANPNPEGIGDICQDCFDSKENEDEDE